MEKLLPLLPRVDEISQRGERLFTGDNPIPQEITVHSQQLFGKGELLCAVVNAAFYHSKASSLQSLLALAHGLSCFVLM